MLAVVTDASGAAVTTTTAAVPLAPHAYHDFVWPGSPGSVYAWGRGKAANYIILEEGPILTNGQKLQVRLSEIRQKLNELSALDAPTDEQRRGRWSKLTTLSIR